MDCAPGLEKALTQAGVERIFLDPFAVSIFLHPRG
jgi:hypothetical protein